MFATNIRIGAQIWWSAYCQSVTPRLQHRFSRKAKGTEMRVLCLVSRPYFLFSFYVLTCLQGHFHVTHNGKVTLCNREQARQYNGSTTLCSIMNSVDWSCNGRRLGELTLPYILHVCSNDFENNFMPETSNWSNILRRVKKGEGNMTGETVVSVKEWTVSMASSSLHTYRQI